MPPSRGDLAAQVVLLEREGRFFIYQPALGLIASGDDVSGAYQKFEEVRRAYLQDVQRAGLEVPTAMTAAPVAGVAINRSIASEMGLFAAKFAVVMVVIAGLVVVAADSISGSIAGVAQGVSRVAASLGSITLADAVNKSDDVVRDLNILPEKRKEDLRRNVGEISRQFTPIVEAWRNPPASPPSK